MDKFNTKNIKEALTNKKSRIYLIVNVFAVVLLAYAFYKYGYGILKCIRYLIIVEALFIIAWIDHYNKLIYNAHILFLLGVRFILLILELIANSTYGLTILTSAITGLLIGFGIFGICYLLSRGGIGAGDVKLMALLGAYLGSSSIMPVLLIIAIVAAGYCIGKLLLKKTTLKDEVPFAPFVLVGTVVSLLIGV